MAWNYIVPDPTKTYTETAASSNSSPFFKAGTKFKYTHSSYGEWECRFVKVAADSGVAISAGDLVHWDGADGMLNGVVNVDQSEVVSLNQSAGIALAACTVAQATAAGGAYICILVRGYYPSVNVAAACAIGDTLIASTTDGQCGVVAANAAITNKPVGWAITADVANVAPAEICVE